MTTLTHRPTRALHVPRGVVEVALLAGLYVLYSASRLVASNDLTSARHHAHDVERVERLLGLHVEAGLNSAASGVAWLAVPMDYWYAALHYVVTPAVMLWVYRRHRADYARVRDALIIGTVIGLSCYLLWPTAPPRLMGGYVDTLAMYAHDGWWSTHASAPAGLGGMTNELAAMPSLHVGWALWCAWAVSRHLGRGRQTAPAGVPGRGRQTAPAGVPGRGRQTAPAGVPGRGRQTALRALPLLYPLGTLTVVVGTGNHWVLDGIVGALVVGVGIVASGMMHRSRPLTQA